MTDHYKSPHGTFVSCVRQNDDIWLCVLNHQTNKHRYFHSTNWTYFEKDLATEITKDEYVTKTEAVQTRIAEILEERARNG